MAGVVLDIGQVRVFGIRNMLAMREREECLRPAGSTVLQCAPDWWRPNDEQHHVVVNGRRLEDFEYAEPIDGGSTATFVVRPAGVPIAGAILGLEGSALAASVGAAVLGAVINIGIGIALNYAIAALIRPRARATERGDQSSATYSWRGIESSYFAEGSPVPVGYGDHPTGGVIIGAYTRVDGYPSESTLYLKILLSEGPIASVGGVVQDEDNLTAHRLPDRLTINGQLASDLDGVKAHVRLGNIDQEAIPGFEDEIAQVVVGLPVPQKNVGASTIAPGAYFDGDAVFDAWEGDPITFTLGTQADSYAIIFGFQGGLYAVSDDTGTFSNRQVVVQERFIEVDEFGSPVAGAKWVVLPARSYSGATTSSFEAEARSEFFDHTTYSVPDGSPWLEISHNTGANLGAYLSRAGVPNNPPSQVEVEFTATIWMRVELVFIPALSAFSIYDPQGVSVTGVTLINFWDDTIAQGWRLWLSNFAPLLGTPAGDIAPIYDDNGNAYTVYKPYIMFAAGDGVGGADTYFATSSALIEWIYGFAGNNTLSTVDRNWVQIGVTYKENADAAGNNRLRFYANGTLIDEQNIAVALKWATGPGCDLGLFGSPTTDPVTCKGHLDEASIWTRELTPVEMSNLYGGGPQVFTIDPQSPGLWALWTMNTSIGSQLDTGPSGNHLDEVLPAGGYVSDWPDGQETSATISGATTNQKRGYYKVEVSRITQELIYAVGDNLGQDQLTWESLRTALYETSTHPGRALLGIEVRATEQLQGGQPTVTVPGKWRKVKIWDGQDPVTPTMVERWSDSAAWCAADVFLNRDYAMGAWYSERDLDLLAFKALADYAREPVNKQAFWALGSGATVLLQYDADVYGVETLVVSVLTGGLIDLSLLKIGADYSVEIVGTANAQQFNFGTTVRLFDWSQVGFNVSLFFEWPIGEPAPVPDTVAGNEVTGGFIYRAEQRYQYDAIHDRRGEDAWDQAVAILQTARAVPVVVGGRISLFIDKPRDPIALVNMSNMKPGSFVLTKVGPNERYNEVTLEFLDRDLNFERSYVERESDELRDDQTGLVTRRKAPPAFMRGITRRSQVARHARHDEQIYTKANSSMQWEMAIEATTFEVGDVIDVGHDVLISMTSGRLIQDSTNPGLVYLDRDFYLGSGAHIELVEGSTGTRASVEINVGVSGGPDVNIPVGSPVAISLPGFTPKKGDLYSIGRATEQIDRVSVVEIARGGDDHTHRIRAVGYNASIYTEADAAAAEASTSDGDAPDPGAAPTAPLPYPPMRPTVDERTAVGEGGDVTIAAIARWRVPPKPTGELRPQGLPRETPDARLAIWVAEATGEFEQITEVAMSSQSAEITGYPFRAAKRYRVAFQSVGRKGARRTLSSSPVVAFVPRGLVRRPGRVTSVASSTRGDRAVLALTGLPRASSIEARRGGGILGQEIVTAPPAGELGPVLDFVTCGTNAQGLGNPRIVVRPKYGNGQLGRPVEIVEADPDWKGRATDLWDTVEEDGPFTGTKVDLAIGSHPDAAFLPPARRGSYLEFSGSSLTGTYTFSAPTLRETQECYVQVHVDAMQVHPTGLGALAVNEPGWSVEGPVAPGAGSGSNCTLVIEERHTSATSFGSESWETFKPGRYFFRLMELRVTVTRANDDYDVQIRRITGRATKVPPARIDHLAIQAFGR